MRPGQNNRRSRGRGNNNANRRPNTPNRNQTFDSNGPDVRIRGTAFQVAEKYQSLARDAASSGDRVLAENYLQHAEHYQRIINAMNEASGQREQSNSGRFRQGREEAPEAEGEERQEAAAAPAEGEAEVTSTSTSAEDEGGSAEQSDASSETGESEDLFAPPRPARGRRGRRPQRATQGDRAEEAPSEDGAEAAPPGLGEQPSANGTEEEAPAPRPRRRRTRRTEEAPAAESAGEVSPAPEE